MEAATAWASVSATVVVAVVGFVLARRIDRDMRLRVAERRLVAYERLWAAMRPASPYDPPPHQDARGRLTAALTDWYYANGDGMLLPASTRSVYLRAKDNLVCPLDRLEPAAARRRLAELPEQDRDRERGLLSQRQLSLLRTQMKGDIAVFGRPYGPSLGVEDVDFLVGCGVDVRRPPWGGVARAATRR